MKKVIISIITCFLLCSGSALADTVVYNSFGAGDTYRSNGDAIGTGQVIAVNFTGSGLFLTEADLAFYSTSGTPSVIVKLLGDNGGLPNSATVVEQWTVSGIPTYPTSQIFNLPSSTNVLLASGITYWLGVFPGASDTSVGWNINSQGFIGEAYSYDGSSWNYSWSYNPVFRIEGTASLPVVEPSSLLLLGLGLVGLAGVRRKIKDQP
jgi:hypothetical protein